VYQISRGCDYFILLFCCHANLWIEKQFDKQFREMGENGNIDISGDIMLK